MQRNCLPLCCRGQAGVVWLCFGKSIHCIASEYCHCIGSCSCSAQRYHVQERKGFSLCLVGQCCAQAFLTLAHPSLLYTLAKRDSKMSVASLYASSVLPECWRSRRALCCCFGVPEGQRKVPPSSVHIPIWLQKAGESTPDHQSFPS